ncbi:MAG: hypothetical protein DCC71_12075 [Proteobacteria bacterium]|nr:MAG: hypothetical protein DCC71_12075 [Pseudomonadota bacterium]
MRDPKHDPHFEANRAWWDGVVPIHEASRGYDRAGFLRGEKPLCPVERAELGPHDARHAGRRSQRHLLVVRDPYFEHAEPRVSETDTTYVDGPKFERRRNCEWNHGVGEIVTALIDAGLALEFVHEHREVAWQALPSMVPVGPGTVGADGRYQSNRMWRLPDAQRDLVPLMWSILARRADDPTANAR